MIKSEITLFVNGEQHTLTIDNRGTLLDVLRDELGLTGTKRSCRTGNCGACTVLMDGMPINSCLVLAVSAQGSEITTIEGLADSGKLAPIQEAFVECGAIQCGYCAPGLIMTTEAFLRDDPSPTEEEIKRTIVGNLCRCTGYVKIVDAILLASERGREQ